MNHTAAATWLGSCDMFQWDFVLMEGLAAYACFVDSRYISMTAADDFHAYSIT